MSFPRYNDYQDSGLNWLGQVPGHWSLRRLGYFFGERREKVSDRDYQPLSVTKDGIVPQLDTAAKTDDGDNRKKVCKGDFAINSRSDRKGSAGISGLDGSVSLISTVLKPKESVHGPFVHHLLRCTPFQEEFYRFGKGIVADLWSTNYASMSGITLAMPPMTEQYGIANFLDCETAKIDALIAEQQRLIELLQEKRQAVISHAVTKGLNPDAPMKDSGVEWLGEVPEHWEIRAIKHLVSTPVTDGPHETPELVDEGVPFISAEAVSSGSLDFNRKRGFITKEEHERFSMKYIPAKYDIYMVKSGATTGVTAIVETDDEFNIWSPLAAIRCGNLVNPYYLLAFMRSRNFQSAVMLGWNFGTQQNIGMKVIENLAVAVPPIDEQRICLEHLETLLKPLQNQLELASTSINLLQERRSALISAAVTGQIDVRGLVTEQEVA